MRAQIGDLIPLELQLGDGATGLFPQALCYNAAGTLLATKNLTHVANGRYTNDTLAMPADASANGAYVEVTYLVYSDSGHTTLASYGQVSEVWIRDHQYLATVGAGATTTAIPNSRAETTTDFFKDALVRYLSGTLKGQVKKIGGYTTGSITLATGYAFTAGGANGDIIEIVTR